MPMLALTEGLIRTTHFDDEMRQLADRHYSRRTVGARQFAYSGRKLVLRDAAGLVLFVWMYPDPAMRMDGQTGYNCAIFRNETTRRSSDIILEARMESLPVTLPVLDPAVRVGLTASVECSQFMVLRGPGRPVKREQSPAQLAARVANAAKARARKAEREAAAS